MKISFNKYVASSRLPAYLPKFIASETSPDQCADILIRKDRKNAFSIIYLPMDYSRQNPGYLSCKLDEVRKEQSKMEGSMKILVVGLMESNEDVKTLANVQEECLRKNQNFILCFQIGEVAQLIADTAELK